MTQVISGYSELSFIPCSKTPVFGYYSFKRTLNKMPFIKDATQKRWMIFRDLLFYIVWRHFLRERWRRVFLKKYHFCVTSFIIIAPKYFYNHALMRSYKNNNWINESLKLFWKHYQTINPKNFQKLSKFFYNSDEQILPC